MGKRSRKQDVSVTDEQDDWDDTDAPRVPDPSEPGEPRCYTAADGTVTPVLCRNCAMWNQAQPWLGDRVMCYPGKAAVVQIDGEDVERPMSENIWSCQSFFVPPGLNLGSAVPRSVGQAAAILKGAALAKAHLALVTKAVDLAQQHGEHFTDLVLAARSAANLIATPDDLSLVYPLLRLLAHQMVTKKRQTAKKQRYQKYDLVAWREGDVDVTGTIVSISLRNKTVEVLRSSGQVTRYGYDAWRDLNPTVTGSAASA